MFIDSHAHLGDEALFANYKEVLERAQVAKVHTIVDICTDAKTLKRGLEIQKNSVQVVLAAATTPHDVEKEGDLFFQEVSDAALQKKLVAIGETGLDYHYEHSPKETQKKHLIRYFHLAKQANLPLIFHCREAFSDLFMLADAEYQSPRAILHCFTGTLEEAKEVLRRGWLLSFSGIITFKKSVELQEVVKHTPLENMLIETDAPYLAPQTKRGKCNEPSFVVETAQAIADLKGTSLEKVAEATSSNAKVIFGL